MNKTEQAQQLRLAAEILETGHPFEAKLNGSWQRVNYAPPLIAIANGNEIRLALATPLDGRPLHNPDNLTAEQVGIGWRLTIKGEKPTSGAQIWMGEDHINGEWEKRDVETDPYYAGTTYRLPISVPWPEAPKPEATTKQVELGPEDVSPLSVIRRKGEKQNWHWRLISYVHGTHAICADRAYEWSELERDYEINRSISLAGKWDANAWEPCSKEVQA